METVEPPQENAVVSETETTKPVLNDESTIPDVDYQNEAAKWKALSRKNEDELTKTRKELNKFREAAMTEQEKAISEAAEKAVKETTEKFANRLVIAQFAAATAGSVTSEVLDEAGVDPGRFLTESGEVNTEKVAAAAKRLAARTNPVDLGQGARSGQPKTIAEQISKAEETGDVKTSLALKAMALMSDKT